jgi:hypothetical protein
MTSDKLIRADVCIPHIKYKVSLLLEEGLRLIHWQLPFEPFTVNQLIFTNKNLAMWSNNLFTYDKIL